MAWTATLTNATQDGTNVTLTITITDGTDTMVLDLVYSLVEPTVNIERVRSDIAHYAKGLGKWEKIQPFIGQVIHSGG